MSVLGSDNVTANGTVTIPDGCVYVVALCAGSVDPPYLNGNMMQTVASVPATGLLTAVSIHVSTFPIVATLPYVMNGADTITWVYLDDAVCTRADVVQGYSQSGQITGSLATSTNDLVLGIVQGSNGQVEIKGDTVALTLLENTSKRVIGWIVPTDTSLTCLGTDNSTVSGYWYYPPAVWVDTTTSVLVEAGHYEFNPVQNVRSYVYDHHDTVYEWYRIYLNGVDTGSTISQLIGSGAPPNYYFTTYPAVWVPDRYETVASGYWEYPAKQWIETGVAGEVSAAWVSIADVMIGGIYVSRPLFC